MTGTREPIAAGRFYKGREKGLVDQIESSYLHPLGPGELPSSVDSKLGGPVGLVLPHAGYPYSGPIASHGFRWLSLQGRPERIVIVGTNHSGRGSPVSIQADGKWSTPLGKVGIDEDLAGRLARACEPAEEIERSTIDREAFSREHSVEVQLPFLQHLYGSQFDFVPICVRDHGKSTAKKLGKALDNEVDESVAVLASSDFTHYEPKDVVVEKDQKALSAISDLDLDLFYRQVEEENISICGVGAIASLLYFSSRRGLSASSLQHATSGDVSDMKGEVVGYAAVAMEGNDSG